MKLSKTKRLYFSFDRTWIQLIYILPALNINWVTKENNLYFIWINDKSYVGKKLNIGFSWIIFDVTVDYWWNLEEEAYDY